MASLYGRSPNPFALRQVGPKTNNQRRAERLTQVLDPQMLVKWAQRARYEATEFYLATGSIPLLNRDLPRVKELYARYVNSRSEATIPSLMHWDNEDSYWQLVCDRTPGTGVKAARAEVKVMRMLVTYLMDNPYYDPYTGMLSIPNVTVVTPPESTKPSAVAIYEWAKGFSGENPIDAVDYVWNWYKEFYGDAK